jgi:hypothetical protein
MYGGKEYNGKYERSSVREQTTFSSARMARKLYPRCTEKKTSRCEFDTSTNAVIQLKTAGVSDSVIQEMIECRKTK